MEQTNSASNECHGQELHFPERDEWKTMFTAYYEEFFRYAKITLRS